MVSVPRWCGTAQEAHARLVLRGATVLLVEDVDVTRTVYCRYLGTSVNVHQAGDVAQALACGLRTWRDLDLAAVDLNLPDGSGWRVIFALHELDSTLRFLVVSALKDTSSPKRLSRKLRERVLFLDKPVSEHQLVVAAAYACCCVRHERGKCGASDVPPRPQVGRRPRHEKLSLRESQAMRGCAVGLTNREIAAQLGISFSTAKKHVSAGFGKLEVSSREEVAEAIASARRARRRG